MIKVGDTVFVRKGTTVHSTARGEWVCGKKTEAYVGQILEPGQSYIDRKGKQFTVTVRSIRWAGSNGYWNTAPITAVLGESECPIVSTPSSCSSPTS